MMGLVDIPPMPLQGKPMAIVVNNAEVSAGANRFARALDRIGVGTRGAVAALLENTPEFLWAYRGATWSGRRFTPLSWRWTPDEAAYVVENCGADAFVADARFANAALVAAGHVPEAARFAVGGPIPGFRAWDDVAAESSAPLDKPQAGDLMLYTSGTTGRPKGVQRTTVPQGPPPTFLGKAGMAMIRAFMGDREADGAHLVASPLYHAGPSTYCDGALLLGADIVLMSRFDPEEFLRLVERHHITSTFLVPTHFVRLLRLPLDVRTRYDLSSLRLVLHGAAPVAPDVKRQMIEWLGPVLFEFYGGTEGGGCMIGSEEWLRKPGSVGRPRPGVRLHILDDEGRALGPGTEGIVYFNLDESPFEYKDDPEKTAENRRGDLFTLGDIGYVDDDGYLFLCDRRADVIISGGMNIYPAQIEAVLLELPLVSDCCVVGAPDDEWGEEVRAVIQVDPACGSSPAEIERTVLGHCGKRLAGYQVPRGVDLHPALPRTETGKLARSAIRAPYWQGRDRRV
jgi:long-chain acyl-CoA synthetase